MGEKGVNVETGFEYNSRDNPIFLDTDEIIKYNNVA
jgi:hypothetical protein